MDKSTKTLRKIVPFVKEYASTRGGLAQGYDENAVCAVLHEGGLNRIKYHYCYGLLKDYPHYCASSSYMASPSAARTNPLAIFLQVQDIPEDQDEEAFRHFYEWLLNYSPFRHSFISKNVSKMLKDRVAVLDAETQADTLGASMISFRQGWEDYYEGTASKGSRYLKTKIWWALAQKIDPAAAFAISNSTLDIIDGKIVYSTMLSGHSPFDAEPLTLINVSRGIIKDNSNPWNKVLKYGSDGLSTIWQTPDPKGVSLLSIIKDGLASIDGGKKKVNPFADEQVIRYDFDKAIAAVAEAVNDKKELIYGV